MDKHTHGCTSMEIDYRDVFGGPPRFAALLSASRSGASSSAVLDKMTARTSSFRSSALPAFDLPVFGDESSAASIYYDSRANSNVYNDMFNEEGPLPDNVLVSNLYAGSRSKASSRSSSRRMSPVHPASASVGQSGGDDRLVAKTRPAVGRLSKRGSLSSTSSFDEIGGKYADALLFGTANDSFSSSVPSSPPRAGSFGCLKSLPGASDDSNVGAPHTVSDADDVYGEFPQTNFTQQFSAVPPNSITMNSTPGSHGGKTLALEKPGLKLFSMSDNLEASNTIQAGFSRSSSTKDGRERRDKQVWMARRTDSSVSERSELAAGKNSFTARDTSFSCESSFGRTHSLGAPTSPLKFKSWKDLHSDSPSVRTPVSKPVYGSVQVVKTGSLEMPMKEAVISNDGLVEKQLDVDAEHDPGNISYSSESAQREKVKSAEPTPDMDMEERELQALLMNAWKVNEEMEREKYSAKFPVEVAKHSTRQTNSLHTEQNECLDMDERDSDINWKEWRKFGRGERRQVPSNHSSMEESRVGLQMQADKDAATSWDTTEVARGSTDKAPTVIVLPDGLIDLDSKKTSVKGGAQKNGEHLAKGQMQGRSDDWPKDSRFRNVTRTLSHEFLNNGDPNRSSVTSQLEDTECLEVGFEEIEGESSERRKLRWERHVRARRRAEKALEELQQRDAELQRQKEEKQQFSETSDEKIRRWAAGKEGNLRALLSNLQHVLWSECGWQPIPLSDLIEVPDVRKAYRKATLFVHPDKMQQKGATLHHKYIAERVFDILQEAWKTFSLQESYEGQF